MLELENPNECTVLRTLRYKCYVRDLGFWWNKQKDKQTDTKKLQLTGPGMVSNYYICIARFCSSILPYRFSLTLFLYDTESVAPHHTLASTTLASAKWLAAAMIAATSGHSFA